mgnify:CR=1 FL=1
MVTETRWPIASTYDNFCELICHILAFCLNSVAIGTAEMSHITSIVNPTILLPIWASELLNIPTASKFGWILQAIDITFKKDPFSS